MPSSDTRRARQGAGSTEHTEASPEDVRRRALELGLDRAAASHLPDLVAAQRSAAQILARLPRQLELSDEPAHIFAMPTEDALD